MYDQLPFCPFTHPTGPPAYETTWRKLDLTTSSSQRKNDQCIVPAVVRTIQYVSTSLAFCIKNPSPLSQVSFSRISPTRTVLSTFFTLSFCMRFPSVEARVNIMTTEHCSRVSDKWAKKNDHSYQSIPRTGTLQAKKIIIINR